MGNSQFKCFVAERVPGGQLKIPRSSGKEILNCLLKNGFVFVRQKGSHAHLTKNTQEKTLHVTVPIHANKDINPFVFKSIARQAGLSSRNLPNSLNNHINFKSKIHFQRECIYSLIALTFSLRLPVVRPLAREILFMPPAPVEAAALPCC